MHAIVYLTAEMKSRDLDSRLLLAAHLLKADIPVVVGQQWGMWVSRDRAWKGCYLFKTANGIQAAEMAKCAAEGHLVVASDEEALALSGPAMLTNLHPDALAHSRLFLAQNDAHKQLLAEKVPASADRIRVTGNVRIDLLAATKRKASIEADEIRERLGRYILFNTGFGLTNSLWGDLDRALEPLIKAGTLDMSTEAGRADVQARVDAEGVAKRQMLALITLCANQLPSHHLVVRPHPAENVDAWRTLVKGTEHRVTVAQGTSVAPWMLGADAVVHSESTTGLEAAVLGVPCLNLSPTASWGAKFMMRTINRTAGSAAEALGLIKEQLASGQGLRADHAAVSRWFPADAASRAAGEIADLLRRTGASRAYPREFGWRRLERPESVKTKFSVSNEEFLERAKSLFASVGPIPFQSHQIDDSLFLLRPSPDAPIPAKRR